MLSNEIQTLGVVYDRMKEHKGETIQHMFDNVFDWYEDIITKSEARRVINNFTNDSEVDLLITHADGVWGVMEMIQYFEWNLEKQAKILQDPCKMVNFINKIRAKNAIRLVLQAEMEKGYTFDSKISDELLSDFESYYEYEKHEKERLSVNDEVDISDDELPF